MCKNPLAGRQMSELVYVEQATVWSRELVRREARGPGDTANAMRRLANRYGIPFSIWWSLRYRTPKEIAVSIYFRLRAAYEAECERQLRKLRDEIAITKAIAGPDHAAVASAQALVDEENH